MPRVMRRLKFRRTDAAASRRVVFKLKKGVDFWFWDPSLGGMGSELGDDILAPCWEELRDELLNEWIMERPGTRPWGWWRYDAPERRRRIGTLRLKPGKTGIKDFHHIDDDAYEVIQDGKPHPFDNPARNRYLADVAREYPEGATRHKEPYFGMPNGWLMYIDDDGSISEDDVYAAYEEEFDYLKRLNLLTPEEIEALAEIE